MTTTTISVNGLRLRAFHGVMEQERRVGNTFELSISLRYPSLEAIATDDISHALNYGEVIETARREMSIPSALLEHAAGRVRDALCRRFPLREGGSITLATLTPPLGVEIASAAVTIEW